MSYYNNGDRYHSIDESRNNESRSGMPMPAFVPQYDYELKGGTPRNFFFAFFPHARIRSMNAINLLFMIVCFLVTAFYTFFRKNQWICTLYLFGAHYQPAVVEDYQVYRWITPLFLHANIPHIIMNSLSLLIYGFVLEDYYGKLRLGIVYLLTGISGNLLSGLIKTYIVSVGASSGIYGVLGLEFFYLYENRNYIGSNFKKYFWLLSGLITLYLFLDFLNPDSNINNFAHLGGFFMGLLMGFYYYFRSSTSRKERIIQKLLLLLIISYFVLMITLTFTLADEDQNYLKLYC